MDWIFIFLLIWAIGFALLLPMWWRDQPYKPFVPRHIRLAQQQQRFKRYFWYADRKVHELEAAYSADILDSRKFMSEHGLWAGRKMEAFNLIYSKQLIIAPDATDSAIEALIDRRIAAAHRKAKSRTK